MRRGSIAVTAVLMVTGALGHIALGADESAQPASMPPPPRCVTGEPKHFQESCAYLDRRDAVAAADAQAPQDALYGIYGFSTGTVGAELALDRDGWAGYHESSDAGVPIRGVAGRYHEHDGVLVVELERVPKQPYTPARLEYRVVRWGTHVYLLQPDRIASVIAMLNRDGLQQTAYWMEWDMQRWRNRKDPLCGSPDVPAEWRATLHPKPLSVTLRNARPDPSRQGLNAYMRRYLIEIDAGRARGLFAQMYLQGTPADSAHLNINALIERVDEHRAWGTLTVAAILTTDSVDALKVGEGTQLVTGAGWDPAACVPMR